MPSPAIAFRFLLFIGIAAFCVFVFVKIVDFIFGVKIWKTAQMALLGRKKEEVIAKKEVKSEENKIERINKM